MTWFPLWTLYYYTGCHSYDVVSIVDTILLYWMSLIWRGFHCGHYTIILDVTHMTWFPLWTLYYYTGCHSYDVVSIVYTILLYWMSLICRGFHCGHYTIILDVTHMTWFPLWTLYYYTGCHSYDVVSIVYTILLYCMSLIWRGFHCGHYTIILDVTHMTWLPFRTLFTRYHSYMAYTVASFVNNNYSCCPSYRHYGMASFLGAKRSHWRGGMPCVYTHGQSLYGVNSIRANL